MSCPWAAVTVMRCVHETGALVFVFPNLEDGTPNWMCNHTVKLKADEASAEWVALPCRVAPPLVLPAVMRSSVSFAIEITGRLSQWWFTALRPASSSQ